MRNVVLRSHQQTNKDVTFSMACSNQPSIPSVPASTPYTGKYGFEISFQKQKKETKSATWTYSQELKKLYVRMRSPCPIRFRTCSPPPQCCLIRAMPLYIKPEHIQEVVRRCPNHVSKADDLGHPPSSSSSSSSSLTSSGDHFGASSEHLLCCENKEAQYVEDAYTGRLSVVFPHELPQAGTDWVTNLFQFACFSSCVGGLNRRPLQVVFTLEHGTEVLGRQAVEVRICACPGRDRRTEERSELMEVVGGIHAGIKQANPTKSGRNISTGSNKRTRDDDIHNHHNHLHHNLHQQQHTQHHRHQPPLAGSKPDVESKRRRDEEGDVDVDDDDDDGDSVYSIKVCGRQNYEMLKRIRDALELSDLIQPEQKSLVLQQVAGNEPQVTLEAPVTYLAQSNQPNHQTHHLNLHQGGYPSGNAYVINDLGKMTPVDQSLPENEVSSTGINLNFVDIQQIFAPRTTLSSLTPSNPLPFLQATSRSNNVDDVDDDDEEDSDVTASSWLESIKMGMYSDQFHGWDDLEKLTPEHREFIWKKLTELKIKRSARKIQGEISTPRQMLAPITEFQQRPPPLPPLDNNNTTIVTFSNDGKSHQHPQQLIQLQQIIVNTHSLHNPSKIELLTPVYYKSHHNHNSNANNTGNTNIVNDHGNNNTNRSNSSELLPINGDDHNYCSET